MTMRRQVLTRVAALPVLLLVVSALVFVLAEVVPGSVGRTILGPYATPAQVRSLERELGADRPLPQRYGRWLGGFLSGRWGTSATLGVPIRPLVLGRLGSSLLLALVATVLIIPLSVGLGVLAGLRQGSAVDRAITIAGVAAIGIPEFVAGVVAIVVVAIMLHLLPVTAQAPDGAGLAERLRYLLLPAVPLGLVELGYLSRMTRAGVVDTLQAAYVRTARLKGLPERTVIVRHVLPNALAATVAVLGVQVGYLIGGLVVVEQLFNYAGIGKLTVDSALAHDVPLLEATALVLAVVYVLCNLAADLLGALLNPRLRHP